MIWTQSVISAVAWTFFGLWAARRADRRPVPRFPFAGIILLVVSAMVMMGGLFLIVLAKGMEQGRLTVPAWIGVTLLGVVFAGGQSVGAVWTLRRFTASETGHNLQTSKPEEPLK